MSRALLSSLTIAIVAACGPVDPAPVDDVPERPGPYDRFLEVIDVSPGEGDIPERPTLRIRFNDYLDDDELLDYSIVSLQSGGLRAAGRVDYEMTTRTLVFEPFGPLEHGLTYQVVVRGDFLRSVTGAPLATANLPRLRVDRSAESATPGLALPSAGWDRVDAIFEAKCRSCHSDPQWALDPLTRDSMIGRPSEQTGIPLVTPFDPDESYLMRKILHDYPLRRFTVQPPPWSGATALTVEETLVVETWIRNGAR